MDHRVGLRPRDGLSDRLGIQRVGDRGPAAHRADRLRLRCGPGHSGDLVAILNQHRDQLLSDGARRARYEDLHGYLLSKSVEAETE